MFRNKLLQLQRGGRKASHIDLEIKGSEEPVAHSRDSLPVSMQGSIWLQWNWGMEQLRAMAVVGLARPPSLPPSHKGMDNWHSGGTFCCASRLHPLCLNKHQDI